jgi:hypothetical protein
MTQTFSFEYNVTVPRAPIHAFSMEELENMGVPEKIIADERDNRMSAELSGGIHTSYCFYYINCEPDNGPATQFWIESDDEAEKLREDIKKELDDYINGHIEADREKTCSFCGQNVYVCDDDHAMEMREIMRNLRRWD